MPRPARWLVLLAVLSSSRLALAQGTLLDRPRAAAAGFQLDAFPTLLSAANGRLGLAPQLWYGVSGVRVRVMFTHFEPPDALAQAPARFHDSRRDAFGASVDYTFGPRVDGPWLGAGYEVWMRSIAHEDAPGRRRWTQLVLIVGGGYIWRFGKTLYLDAGLAAQAPLASSRQTLAGEYPYRPEPLEVAGSVKLGCAFSL